MTEDKGHLEETERHGLTKDISEPTEPGDTTDRIPDEHDDTVESPANQFDPAKKLSREDRATIRVVTGLPKDIQTAIKVLIEERNRPNSPEDKQE